MVTKGEKAGDQKVQTVSILSHILTAFPHLSQRSGMIKGVLDQHSNMAICW